MQKIMLFLIILFFVNISFANIQVLENSDGRIVAKVSFGEFVYEKDANPMIFLNFTADKNSKPQISVTPQNRFTKKVSDKLEKREFSHILNFSIAQDIPLFAVGVSPVLKTFENEISYTTEMIVVINYHAGTTRNIVPRNDYYSVISSKVLNPDKIENTIRRSESKNAAFLSVQRNLRLNGTTDKPALRFWIGDAASAANELECDLQARVTDSAGAGIYKIVPSDLQQLGSNLEINKIRIRAANPNIVNDTTPEVSAIPDGLTDVPLIVRDKNNNGIFDGTDEILFYAEKIHTWYFNERNTSWDFLFNYTDFRRYYWITKDDQQTKMPKFINGETGGTTLQTGDVYYRGKRSTNVTTAYDNIGDKRWVWTTLRNGGSISSSFPNNFLVNSLAGDAEIRFLAHEYTTTFSMFKISIGNTDKSYTRTNMGKWLSFQNEKAANFSFVPTFAGGTGYMDFDAYDLHYSQRLSLNNIQNLQFYSKGGAKTSVSYKISDLPAKYRLLVRHNPKTQKTELIDSLSTGTNLEFSDTSGNGYKYHLATDDGFLRIQKRNLEIINLPAPLSFQISDLLNPSNRTDYLIIAPDAFLSQANELAKHKQDIGQFISPKVVCVEDIFKIFSGGVFSPEAIRNFMVYAKYSWQESGSYLTLFGGGHYDYKKILDKDQPNYIPIYIAEATDYNPQLIAYPIEDFFVYTVAGTIAGTWNSKPDSAAFPQMIVGRIPVMSDNEAQKYLEKIKAMENSGSNDLNTAFSAWRNRHLLLADDDIQADLRAPEALPHTKQSDSIGIIIDANDRSADIRKVTLFEFPFDNQLNKPLARSAFIGEINNGVSVVNYFGHGSSDEISDQGIFHKRDIVQLSNFNKYFIFGAFSCSGGYFDHPTNHGLSEMLVRTAEKGAINTVSSARTAYSTENAYLANDFYRGLFDKNMVNSVGQAYLSGKMKTNPPTFVLLGDPSYTPMINRKRFSDIRITDEKLDLLDTLKKMQNVIISGNLPIANDGTARIAEVILQNPENTTSARKDGLTFPIPPVTDGKPYQYTLPGMIAARQSFEFSGNHFEIPLMIPPSVLDTTLGSRLKIHIRNKNGGNEIFTGVKDTGIVFLGWDTTNIDINDKEGPTVVVQQFFSDSQGNIDAAKNNIVGNKITIDGFNKNSGTATLGIRISDKSGVDIFSSAAPGGGVSVSIDRVMSRKQYGKDELNLINDDFRNCSLSLQISQKDFPAVGEYELTVTTRDVLQNITVKRYILDVKSLSDEQYTIGDFFCYPSPVLMGQRTQFFFNQPVDNVSEISLKIYTLNGKLVRSFPNVRRGQSWDLTDQYGRKLSPNVYLYRLFVKRKKRSGNDYQNFGNKTEIIKSKIKKLVIYPPK